MTTDASAPDSGPLSVDQAVAMLGELPKKEEPAPEAPQAPAQEGKTDSPAEPTAEDAQGAETQTEGEETAEQKEQEEEKSELPPIEPPKFWDAKSKERFGELPRDVQEIIAAKEADRDKFVSKTTQDAAERRNALDAQLQRIQPLTQQLDSLLPTARAMFANKWDKVDWDATLTQYGAEQTLRFRNQMEAEKQQLQALEETSKQAETIKLQQHTQAQTARLAEVAPDLADPVHGKQRLTELGKFLQANGATRDRITWLTAEEASIAYDAMRWRNGQAEAAKLVAAKTPPAPRKVTPAKPAASAPARSTNQARIDVLSRKRELSIDEAVELANLKGQAA